MAAPLDCVEKVISTGKIDSALINSVFGGRNLGMDAFRAHLSNQGLSLEYDAWRHHLEWYIAAKDAASAFAAGITYRPRTFGLGQNRIHPREDGVEYMAGELIRYEYQTNWSGGCRKRIVARKHIAREFHGADAFCTDYREVL